MHGCSQNKQSIKQTKTYIDLDDSTIVKRNKVDLHILIWNKVQKVKSVKDKLMEIYNMKIYVPIQRQPLLVLICKNIKGYIKLLVLASWVCARTTMQDLKRGEIFLVYIPLSYLNLPNSSIWYNILNNDKDCF